MTICVLGEAIADLVPTEQGLYDPKVGGSPFNFARCLARLEVPVRYVSPISSDALGGRMLEEMRLQGVACDPANRSLLPTSLALVAYENGQPHYSLYREGIADTDFTVEGVLAQIPEDALIFHTGSLMLVPDVIDRVAALLVQLRSRGMVISLDINLRPGVARDQQAYCQKILALLPLADVVKASDEDLTLLGLDISDIDSIIERYFAGSLLVFTRGEQGATAIVAGQRYSVPAYTVSCVQDTIGAGDTFYGAFIARMFSIVKSGQTWADEALLSDALKVACAAAAINVTRAGCQPPSMVEIEAVIEGRVSL
jgi:fructokinase